MSVAHASGAEDVLGDLRHDVRSPLTVIVGYAELLATREKLSEDDRREYARRIAAAAVEIRELIDEARV